MVGTRHPRHPARGRNTGDPRRHAHRPGRHHRRSTRARMGLPHLGPRRRHPGRQPHHRRHPRTQPPRRVLRTPSRRSQPGSLPRMDTMNQAPSRSGPKSPRSCRSSSFHSGEVLRIRSPSSRERKRRRRLHAASCRTRPDHPVRDAVTPANPAGSGRALPRRQATRLRRTAARSTVPDGGRRLGASTGFGERDSEHPRDPAHLHPRPRRVGGGVWP